MVSQSIYDPFGKRIEVYQASYLKNYTTMPTSEAGYTGHKVMEAVGIIHMKGRILNKRAGKMPIEFARRDTFNFVAFSARETNTYNLRHELGVAVMSADTDGVAIAAGLMSPAVLARTLFALEVSGLAYDFSKE